MPTTPATSASDTNRGSALVRAATRRSGASLVALPALALAGDPINTSPLLVAVAAVLAVAVALAAWRAGAPATVTRIAGGGASVLGAWLLSEASYTGSGLAVAVLIGGAAGLLVAGTPVRPAASWLLGAFPAAAALLAIRLFWGPGQACASGVVIALAAMAAALWGREAGRGVLRARHWLPGATVIYGAFAVFWVGSTSPSITWFGDLTSHGPRSGNQVALTFDDGPDGEYTRAIASILDAGGVRGTFFVVGKALRKEPDVERALLAKGHVLGNHSYDHDAYSYLDPRYGQLAETQEVFRETLALCPALFRPPHGTHTPFMSRAVSSAGMTLVTWDVSARDWEETDARRLARNILAKVRPGSIILLHDGIDGIPGADRSVVVRALPAILEGLRARGLEPVTLDRLLGVPAYLPSCP